MPLPGVSREIKGTFCYENMIHRVSALENVAGKAGAGI